MSQQIKYLKDENNEVFSPITSVNSIYLNNSDSCLGDIVPLIYKFNQSSYSTGATLFSGNIDTVSLIKIYGFIQTNSVTTSKAIYLRINGKNCSAQYVIDARYRDAKVQYYHRVQNADSDIYIGDVAYSGNTSYFEIIIPNRQGTAWNCIKSTIGNATKNTDQHSWSCCSGQFEQLITPLTKIELSVSQNVQTRGIIQIYR